MTTPARNARIVTAKAVIDDYTDLAPAYDRQWGGINRSVRFWVMDRFPTNQPAGARVLDAGCGTGHMLPEIAADWPLHKIDAIDICPAMLALAAQKAPQANFIEADLAHHDYGARRYDTVLSLNVLHHMNDAAAHLRALVDATALGGSLFLCDTAVDGFSMTLSERHWRRLKPSHARAFSRAELTALLHTLPVTITDSALLRPDIFWRLQIYHVVKKG